MVADRNNGSNGPSSAERSEAAEAGTSAGFPVVRRGYDPEAVEAYLRRLDAQVNILGADRDAAVEQSRQMGVELEACRARVERLRGQVSALSEPGLIRESASGSGRCCAWSRTTSTSYPAGSSLKGRRIPVTTRPDGWSRCARSRCGPRRGLPPPLWKPNTTASRPSSRPRDARMPHATARR